ncbi:hypothetical protein LGR54_17860 [Ancylobacter sp. Lp-2]|uniref:hypothetical protein n=1 Tax=Ancylobacter sp. Lp-2 TaxID=2881339 RepID=UPI001E3507B6|nr:hypothetical protein [Ancylobacter sp. Lp-2]MCB4770478.1 hypothetical protein [Ancylobacter sp. Lp-2]
MTTQIGHSGHRTCTFRPTSLLCLLIGVRQRLAEIQDINRKAITFKYGLIDNRRSMNGLDALNVGGVVTSPSGQQGAPQQPGMASPGSAGAGTQSAAPPAGAPQGARQAPDGNWYVPDPARPGKYLKVQP